jgi:hypothetical protein
VVKAPGSRRSGIGYAQEFLEYVVGEQPTVGREADAVFVANEETVGGETIDNREGRCDAVSAKLRPESRQVHAGVQPQPQKPRLFKLAIRR